jgi:ATP-dependent RNA helicase DDX23/PRP28
MPPAVEKIARNYLRSPAYIYIGDQSSTRDDIAQSVLWVKESHKLDTLFELLHSGPRPPVIVFVNTKHAANVVSKALSNAQTSVATIHGGKSQEQRETALETFKSKQADVLVATDVVGRGIDIEGVEHVIQYDLAQSIDAYTHRIGRTGRAGRKGVATALVTGEGAERDLLYDLRRKLEECKQPVPQELARHEAAQAPKEATGFGPPKPRTQFAKY